MTSEERSVDKALRRELAAKGCEAGVSIPLPLDSSCRRLYGLACTSTAPALAGLRFSTLAGMGVLLGEHAVSP